ncbi:type II toxin-antitoxin system VapC family toxin [Asticcacaulis sp. AC402]|uniref:type II toxin-antitoxin system VapC family toxin n=1 Tax=Asticcacaulis sp. AC402 TaxID=1282361 RepID=UPI0003C3BD47|nr:type II toxin-antitoxin system VapC family toxin [Asticcacaulis sp. AC402]ESQ77145.1 hypothetical protein ABAC402_01735 [Asticcacaulis sp. AC402]
MIAVDSSALLAVVLNEAMGDTCDDALQVADHCILSAAILTEVMLVAGRYNVRSELQTLLDALDVEIVPVDEIMARHAVQAYVVWGKGRHPAGLNIMDCFSYAVAKAHNCPLLFIGNDFSQTDIQGVL